MHHTDQAGRSSTCGILADRAKGSSERGATAAHPATSPPHNCLTYSPRAGPVSARLVFQSSRWLRHQHTEELGFLGPSMVATSPNRAFVPGRTTVLTGPGYASAWDRMFRLDGSRAEILEDGEDPAVVGRGGRKVELEEDVRDVLLHRARADLQLLDDPAVGPSLGHQPQHVEFPWGEPVDGVVVADQ